MEDKMRNAETDKLFKAVLNLTSVDECYDFFEDLCTVAELRAMTQRFTVVLMLSGNTVYSEIVEKTGASSATVSRVNHALQYGKGGYKTAIARLKK
ncbi:MAG: TrpR-like protein, YerC/YecD [Clostridia bacterium]|nr:TrpR-like protein, YerC/YecD [Clostridia bacterium]